MVAPLNGEACTEGYVGILCGACAANFVADKSGSCVHCDMDQQVSWGVLVGAFLGVVALAIFVGVFFKKLSKASTIESALLALMYERECAEGIPGVKRWLRSTFNSSTSGDGEDDERDIDLSKEDIEAGLKRIGVRFSQKEAKKLFAHLDQDNNGHISSDEFITFIRGARHGAVTGCRARVRAVKDWATSNRTSTMITVLFAYGQTIASVPKMYGVVSSSRTEGSALFSLLRGGSEADSSSSSPGTAQALAADVAGLVTDLDVTVVAWFRCLVYVAEHGMPCFIVDL